MVLGAQNGAIITASATKVASRQFEVVGDQFDRVGPWTLVVTVYRGGRSDAVLAQTWTVEPSTTESPVAKARWRIAPATDAGAIAVLAITLVALAMLTRRRHVPRLPNERIGRDADGIVARKNHGDCRTDTDHTRDGRRAAVRLGDRHHQGQTEPRAASSPLEPGRHARRA